MEFPRNNVDPEKNAKNTQVPDVGVKKTEFKNYPDSKNAQKNAPVYFGGPKIKRVGRKKRTTQKLNAMPIPVAVNKQPEQTSILKEMEEKFQDDENLMKISNLISELKKGPLAQKILAIKMKVKHIELAKKRHNNPLLIDYVSKVVDKMKSETPQVFQIKGQDEDFIAELISLSLIHEFDNLEMMNSYVKDRMSGYLVEYCDDYLINPTSRAKNLSLDAVEKIISHRDELFSSIKSKRDLEQHIIHRLNDAQNWIRMYEFFIGNCAVAENGIGKTHVANIISEAIKKDEYKKIRKTWELIKSTREPQNISSGVSGKVKAVVAIAGIAIGASGLAYMGYEKFAKQNDDGDVKSLVSKQGEQNRQSNGQEEPSAKRQFVSTMRVTPMNVASMKTEPTKIVSGGMDIRQIDDMQKLPKKEPSIVIKKQKNQDALKNKVTVTKANPVKPHPKLEVVHPTQTGLVQIDKQSLAKMQDSEYKKMFEGNRFSLNEIKGRSITGLIEKYLMSQAHGRKEKRAYRKNLQKLEKGWLIYMRKLELRVKNQLANGESVNERDMADYDYWMMYKTDHIRNYEKAKNLTKRYDKLANKGKKTKNFQRYQEYLDMGTSLMVGLRTLNPKVASVNLVSSWQNVRIANEKGQVLEYLLDVSGKMGLAVPDKATVVAHIKKEKKNSIPEICKIKEEKTNQITQKDSSKKKFASGLIENHTDSPNLRTADLNAFSAVTALEDIMFNNNEFADQTPDVGMADLFPWEKAEIISKQQDHQVHKINVQKEQSFKTASIEIDASDWETSDEVGGADLFKNEMNIDASDWETSDEVGSKDLFEQGIYEDFYDEYKVEMNIDASDWETSDEVGGVDLFENNSPKPILDKKKSKKKKKGILSKIGGWLKKKLAA